MIELGYQQLQTDTTCFIRADNHGTTIILAVYVDDIVIMGRSIQLIETTKDELKGKFKVKDLGPINWILGVTVERDIPSGT